LKSRGWKSIGEEKNEAKEVMWFTILGKSQRLEKRFWRGNGKVKRTFWKTAHTAAQSEPLTLKAEQESMSMSTKKR